jgi:hypothetical protein
LQQQVGEVEQADDESDNDVDEGAEEEEEDDVQQMSDDDDIIMSEVVASDHEDNAIAAVEPTHVAVEQPRPMQAVPTAPAVTTPSLFASFQDNNNKRFARHDMPRL